MNFRFLVGALLTCSLIAGQAYGLVTTNGGWDVAAEGASYSAGESFVVCAGGDPSITLGITSASSLYGAGSISDTKTGSHNATYSLGGYELAAGFDGTVSSSLLLEEGSGFTSSTVIASVTGMSTGLGSYDLFGSADVLTEGYLYGVGLGESSAEGSASYDGKKSGTTAEIWGESSGESSLLIQGFTADSYSSTGGEENGLHASSRVTKTIAGVQTDNSIAQISSYGSVINNAKANVTSAGVAQSGAWDGSFASDKSKLENENVAASTTGSLRGYVESNGYLDAADVSAALDSTATLYSDSVLQAWGGPATYAASTQTSSATRTYAETWVEDAVWGSVVRNSSIASVIQYGSLAGLGSGAHVYESGANATSFGKIFETVSYDILSANRETSGNLSLQTYAEASKRKKAFAGTLLGSEGAGNIGASDASIVDWASYKGGLFHYSYIDAAAPWAETHNILGELSVSTDPLATEGLTQPYSVSTANDPNFAWSTSNAYFRSRL